MGEVMGMGLEFILKGDEGGMVFTMNCGFVVCLRASLPLFLFLFIFRFGRLALLIFFFLLFLFFSFIFFLSLSLFSFVGLYHGASFDAF